MAHNVSELGLGDKLWVRDVARAMLAELDVLGDPGTRQLQRAIARELRELEEHGDARALAVLDCLATDGLRGHAEAVIAEGKIPVYVASTGETIDLRPRAGVKQKGERGYQQQLFLFLAPDEYRRYVGDLRAAHRTNGAKLAAHEELLKLLDKHPDAANLWDACLAEGIDPNELAI